MKAIRILIKGNKKPRVFIEHLKSYKNSRYGRSDWIRTSGHLNPIQVLYQTEPHPAATLDSILHLIKKIKRNLEKILKSYKFLLKQLILSFS